MLKPDKHLNLDMSVINLSSFVLSKFKRRSKVNYEELLVSVKNNFDDSSEEVFPYALNFLFLLDKIIYEKETDSFILNEIK